MTQNANLATHNPKAVGSNPTSAINHVYAPGDTNTITGGVYFCDVGFYKALDTHVIEVFSVYPCFQGFAVLKSVKNRLARIHFRMVALRKGG